MNSSGPISSRSTIIKSGISFKIISFDSSEFGRKSTEKSESERTLSREIEYFLLSPRIKTFFLFSDGFVILIKIILLKFCYDMLYKIEIRRVKPYKKIFMVFSSYQAIGKFIAKEKYEAVKTDFFIVQTDRNNIWHWGRIFPF